MIRKTHIFDHEKRQEKIINKENRTNTMKEIIDIMSDKRGQADTYQRDNHRIIKSNIGGGCEIRYLGSVNIYCSTCRLSSVPSVNKHNINKFILSVRGTSQWVSTMSRVTRGSDTDQSSTSFEFL